jgi:hypothetical protein
MLVIVPEYNIFSLFLYRMSKTSSKTRTKKSVSIDEFKNKEKEFRREFKTEEIPKLWITSNDRNIATMQNLLERSGYEPKIYMNASEQRKQKLIQKAREEDAKTNKEIKKYVKDTLQKLAEERKDYIQLKRQPPLSKSMLQSFHHASTKKGGRHRNRRHLRVTRKVFWKKI